MSPIGIVHPEKLVGVEVRVDCNATATARIELLFFLGHSQYNFYLY